MKIIAIKGFEMPRDCVNCVMQFGGWCMVSPPEVDERVAETVLEAIEQGKPEWCPLVEVQYSEETEEMNTARWIFTTSDDWSNVFRCSRCFNVCTTEKFEDSPIVAERFFCSRCGAKMRRAEDV